MQSSSNAGIIIYRETMMPQFLSMLALPKLEGNITIAGEEQELGIYLFDCPVAGEKLDRKRYKLLRELVDKNKIKFLVERFEAKVQSNVTPKKNEPHYRELLEEVRAIKQLAALIKLSQDRNENLLESSMGFIISSIDSVMMDYLTEEACNVMFYEGPYLNEKLKGKLHNDFMERKGISIVFTKDKSNVITNSSIIIIDEGVDLQANKEELKDKIILGSNKAADIKGISNVILWVEELDKYDPDNIPYVYNDEVLAIMRYFNMKLDIIDFVKTLPYIYFREK